LVFTTVYTKHELNCNSCFFLFNKIMNSSISNNFYNHSRKNFVGIKFSHPKNPHKQKT
jgi:hypothetical protein